MQKYSEYSDDELLAFVREGQMEIIDFLVERYKGLVKKKAHKMYLIGGETEDLIQEGMIGLFKAVRDYNPDKETSFYTFASLCIDRQLCKAVEAGNRKKNQPLNTSVSLNAEDGEYFVDNLRETFVDDPESILIDKENVKDLEKQIYNTLSRMERRVLEYHLEGYGYNKISQIMGKTPKSIDNALQRIRSKIKSNL